ncbi:MAG: DUF5777 family beta-barrel protein, partial [Bacteroidota bacterium]
FSSATFKSTRLINFQTVETVGPKTLDFRISHRFGPVNSGAYNAWGLDGPASIRLGLDYSYDGRFMVGIGRSSVEKMVDAYFKVRLLRQTVDNKTPVSITLFSGAYRNGLRTSGGPLDPFHYPIDRFSYVNQIIIAKKFSPSFSFQLSPFFVHYNIVNSITDKNDMYGVAAATRIKFSKRSAITLEYAWRYPNDYSLETKYYDSFGIGYELETGGHVFQVHLTNSFGIAENQYLARTSDTWSANGIHLGFNISRVFTIPAGGGKSDW